jgi:hypothetical protein
MSIHSAGLSKREGLDPSQIGNHKQGPPAIVPKYAPIPVWNRISGMGRTTTYEALGRGYLRAIKLNSRTLIDVEHGLSWLATLPPAQITTGRRRGAPAQNEMG